MPTYFILLHIAQVAISRNKYPKCIWNILPGKTISTYQKKNSTVKKNKNKNKKTFVNSLGKAMSITSSVFKQSKLVMFKKEA